MGDPVTRKKVEISASIMCIDWLDAGRQLRILDEQNIDYLHFDVIDGRFAPDFTMGSSIINRFRANSRLPSDYHLMVDEPNRLFPAFQVQEGDTFTIHQECCRNLHRDLVTVRRMGAKVGVAICPGTPIDALEYVIEDVDVVLVMTVNPGYMGGQLVPQTLRKVEKLRQLIGDMKLDIRIAVDGNVNYENVPNMVAAGADILVGGSSGLFRSDMSLEDAIARLRDCIELGLERI
jgi:ribulose-phosphate 3-epimerase